MKDVFPDQLKHATRGTHLEGFSSRKVSELLGFRLWGLGCIGSIGLFISEGVREIGVQALGF